MHFLDVKRNLFSDENWCPGNAEKAVLQTWTSFYHKKMIPIKYNYVELDLQYMKLFSIIVMTRKFKRFFLLKFRN